MFRKGQVLLGPEEMEGEYPGEDLRKEVYIYPSPITILPNVTSPCQLLEAQLERPPPRPITDDFLEGGPMPPYEDPIGSAPSTPIIEDAPKPPPRPYISRSRSSSAAVGGPDSPLTPTHGSPVVPGRPTPLRTNSIGF